MNVGAPAASEAIRTAMLEWSDGVRNAMDETMSVVFFDTLDVELFGRLDNSLFWTLFMGCKRTIQTALVLEGAQ